MERSLLSRFFILSNSSALFTYSMTSGVNLSKYLKNTWQFRQRNRQIGRNFRCLCTVSVSKPATPDTSSSSVKGKMIVSGVQPTGSMHLGNYVGVIKNWISLEITLPYDTQQLSKATRDTTTLYLACGVDTSTICPAVLCELMWLLTSATPIGWLNRMIQFKEKSQKASDFVPVCEDQKLHLELTRELAECVNYLFGGWKWKKLGGRGGAIFKVPEHLIPPAGARVMSLTDGFSKMSKSAPSDQLRINLLDPKDVIANKIKRCKTDSFSGLEFDNPERPEWNNLLSVCQLITANTKQEVAEECQDMNWGTFKNVLTDALVDHLHPIQVQYEEIMSTGLLGYRFGRRCQ